MPPSERVLRSISVAKDALYVHETDAGYGALRRLEYNVKLKRRRRARGQGQGAREQSQAARRVAQDRGNRARHRVEAAVSRRHRGARHRPAARRRAGAPRGLDRIAGLLRRRRQDRRTSRAPICCREPMPTGAASSSTDVLVQEPRWRRGAVDDHLSEERGARRQRAAAARRLRRVRTQRIARVLAVAGRLAGARRRLSRSRTCAAAANWATTGIAAATTPPSPTPGATSSPRRNG